MHDSFVEIATTLMGSAPFQSLKDWTTGTYQSDQGSPKEDSGFLFLHNGWAVSIILSVLHLQNCQQKAQNHGTSRLAKGEGELSSHNRRTNTTLEAVCFAAIRAGEQNAQTDQIFNRQQTKAMTLPL